MCSIVNIVSNHKQDPEVEGTGRLLFLQCKLKLKLHCFTHDFSSVALGMLEAQLEKDSRAESERKFSLRKIMLPTVPIFAVSVRLNHHNLTVSDMSQSTTQLRTEVRSVRGH